MKTNLLCLLALLLLLGCSKSEETVVTTPTRNCYPQTMLLTEGSSTKHYRYVYDEQNQLVQIEDYSTGEAYSRYTYDGLGNLVYSEDLKQGEMANYLRYHYDEHKRLSKAEFFHAVPVLEEPNYYFTYTYNPDHSLKERETHSLRFTDHEPRLTNYENGSKSSYSFSSEHSLHLVHTFGTTHLRTLDNHITFSRQKSPFWALPAYLKQLQGGGIPQTNNIVSIVAKEGDREWEGSSYTSTFRYTPEGYPQEEVRRYKNGKEQRYSYTYTCD